MDCLIAFEDGANGYLAHYGTKGMKWGVHNEETKRRYGEGGMSANKAAVISGATSAALTLATSGGNPLLAGVTGVTAAVTSKAASSAKKNGRKALEKVIKDPEKLEQEYKKYSEHVDATASGTSKAAMTYLATGGNVPLAAMAFGAGYASSRISSKAVNAGKPAIDKLVKDPAKREVAYKAANVAITAASYAGMKKAGSVAVNKLVEAADMNYYLNNVAPKPTNEFFEQLHGVYSKPDHNTYGPGGGISQQLSTANIPDTLRRRS